MFSLRWMPIAFDQMAKIILNHPSRKSEFAVILKAVAQTLGSTPASVGESREDNNRIVFWGQLSFVYRVMQTEKRVEVLSVVYSDRG